MTDPNENLPSNAGRSPLGPTGSTLDADEKAMQSGKGRMLFAMIGAAVLAVGGLIWFMAGGDEKRVYRDFARTVNTADTQGFDGFWSCALQRGGNEASNFRNNGELADAVNRRATNGRARFGELIRSRCLPKIVELKTVLDGVIPPQPLQEDVEKMRKALDDLRLAWSAFNGHLDSLGQDPYDPEAEDAVTHMNAIAHAWYDYKSAHRHLNTTLRQHLNQ